MPPGKADLHKDLFAGDLSDRKDSESLVAVTLVPDVEFIE
jgi:hypothetical protein